MPIIIHQSNCKDDFPPYDDAQVLKTNTGKSAVFGFKIDNTNNVTENQKIKQIELTGEMIEALKKSKHSSSIC